MKRTALAYVATISITILASCNPSTQEVKAKAEQAQQVANEKIAQANVEAQQKVDLAQKEANEKIAEFTAKTTDEASKAQLAANQDIRTGNVDALKSRNDYQVEVNKSVNSIDNQMDRLKVKAQTADLKNRTRIDTMMPKVVALRAAVINDLASLPNQTAQSLASFKTKTDKDISDWHKSVDEVEVVL